jgi:uncharacterized protein YndB with AHSA1/START domain
MSGAARSHERHHEPTVVSQPTELENRVTRLFRAPVQRVFHLFTDRSTAPLIFSSHPERVDIEEMDFRPGGRYRIRVRQENGSTVAFSGEYREIVPPRRIVNTFEVDVQPGVVAEETDEFEPVGEFTRITITWKYARRADRDAMYGPEMQAELTSMFENVDEALLGEMPSAPRARARA